MDTITVSNLGKAYKVYATRWSRLAEWLDPRERPRHRLNWVLQDITFSVSPGEAVGIIGINGAGKSTLLKMITQTVRPTTGTVAVQGRIAALLELGMGFHPEFTGRQNALMAGQLLGISSAEMQTLMPQIEQFAEIGEYIDKPVRVYSSGMQMRIAFSVATAIRPDVLIVDEALSVGDAYFQHKSFSRIRTFREQGTTLLLVSHDKQAIQSICDRAILLSGGKLLMQGEPEAVLDFYNASLADTGGKTIVQEKYSDGKTATRSGTGDAQVTTVSLLDEAGKLVETVDVGQPVILSIDVVVHADIRQLVLGFSIKNRLGEFVFGTNTHYTKQTLYNVEAGRRLKFEIKLDMNIGPGTYSVQTALVSSETHLTNNYDWRDLALLFNVVNLAKPHFEGSTWIDSEIGISDQ